jgi:[protein-PII] uridylyltransferase
MTSETRTHIECLKQKRDQLVAQLFERPAGLTWCSEHTRLADEAATAIYQDLLEEHIQVPEVAVIATGGYGRRELCVWSDIDITIVPSLSVDANHETAPDMDRVIRRLFQDIHWAFSTVLRLEVGYAYRLISDASGLDARTRTGLLDMRLLAGSENLFRQLEMELADSLPAGEFMLAKIQEREAMYQRFQDTPWVIEPQLKEGAGGLRDAHCANWLGVAMGERAVLPNESYDRILKYRNLLHAVAAKGQDHLSRGRQSQIADQLGFTTTQLVREVTEAGQQLFQSYESAKQKLHEARFTVSPGVVSVRGEVRILPTSSAGTAATGVAIATKLGLSVSEFSTHVDNPEAGFAALFAISTGEKTLRNLDRCGLLSQLLPQLTACRNLSGEDSSHTFTVMEHSLRVVRNLDCLAKPEPDRQPDTAFLADLRDSVVDVEPLYLAALLHDVGKSRPYEDHAKAGAVLTQALVELWELDHATADLTVWLVDQHLTMDRFLRMRDLDHPSTVSEFAQIVGFPERLKLLTLLTWADVNAVAPGAWTAAQGLFLKLLHDRTLAVLQGDLKQLPEPSQSRQRLLKKLQPVEDDAEEVERFLESLPAYYLTSTDADLVKFHLALAKRAAAGSPTVEHHSLPSVGATEITVCSLDSPGLLSRLLGVLYAQDISLLGVRACTTNSIPPVAIDVFTVLFGGRQVPLATLNQTSLLLRQVLSDECSVDELLVDRSKDPNLQQQVDHWTFLPGHPGILEIRTPRGRGMPFRFSRLFAKKGWNIIAARVGQWAGTGAAAFYLLGPNGEELTTSQVARLFKRTEPRKQA